MTQHAYQLGFFATTLTSSILLVAWGVTVDLLRNERWAKRELARHLMEEARERTTVELYDLHLGSGEPLRSAKAVR